MISSGMEYRNPEVHMGLPGIGEFDIFRTDQEEIRRARLVLEQQMNQDLIAIPEERESD